LTLDHTLKNPHSWYCSSS